MDMIDELRDQHPLAACPCGLCDVLRTQEIGALLAK